MSFSLSQAQQLLLHARRSGRLPHALLLTGTPTAGTHQLALALRIELLCVGQRFHNGNLLPLR